MVLKVKKKILTGYLFRLPTMAVVLFVAEDMSTIVRNFKLGFGSFVDKAVMPYVSTAQNK